MSGYSKKYWDKVKADCVKKARVAGLARVARGDFDNSERVAQGRRVPPTPAADLLVTFGVHKGKRWREVPTSYLDWLTSMRGGMSISSEAVEEKERRTLAQLEHIRQELLKREAESAARTGQAN